MNPFAKKKAAGEEDGRDEVETPQEEVAIGRTQEWTAGSQLGSRAMLGLLVMAIAAGPVGGLVGYRGGQQAAAAASTFIDNATAENFAPDVYVLAERAGQEAVEAWLSATRDDRNWIDAVLPGQAGDRLPEVATEYSSVMPAEVAPAKDGLWSVTIAASVQEPAPTEDQANATQVPQETPAPTSVRRYYLVTVRVDVAAGTAAALTLPAPVGAPAAAVLPDLPQRYSIPLTAQIPTTVGAFLQALLAGDGEVDRYLTPGAAVNRLPSPAYASTAVREVLADVAAGELEDPAEAATARVLVHAELTRFDGSTVPVTYVLDLTSRSGRWEITSITTPTTTTEGESA